MRTLSSNIALPSFLIVASTACLNSVEGPDIPTQGTVSYGDRIYLVDDSFDPDGTRQNRPAIDNQDSDLPGICTRLTTPIEDLGGAETSSIAALLMNAGFTAQDDGPALDEPTLRSPQNCFVPLSSGGELTVDTTEVTTELYQFCIDSGFCDEPDPSEADNKADICEDSDDGFNDCPIVNVSQAEAREFCSFIGRRLPSSFEAIMIRQHGWTASGDAVREPTGFTAFPTGATAPADCEDAHLQRFDCGPPQRLSPPIGAATDDFLTAGEAEIFDLVGHVAEWVDDGFPSNRNFGVGGADASLPWFCIGLVGQDQMTGAPVCPTIEGTMDPFSNVRFPCIYGYYDPDEAPSSLGLQPRPVGTPDLPYDLYPVCLTTNTGAFQGGQGALFGGNYVDVDDDTGRVFSRRLEPTPNDPENPQNANAYGFRCVDDIEAGMGADNFSTLQVDANFMP
ncbi:MAG: SUMF1/EgtB/PvdO family nonheme iron enzyme [Myxococcota bacterium]